MTHNTRRAVRGTSLCLSAAFCLGLPLVASAPAFASEDTDACSLATSEITFDAKPDVERTTLFHNYAATSGKWSGGDGTFSIPLNDGRIAWLFSDSLIGEVTPENTRPLDTAFVNNSFVVEGGGVLESRFPLTNGEPSSLIPAPTDEPEGWYWVGDGMQSDTGAIQIIGQRYWYGGGGMWDFGWHSNHLAQFDTVNFELRSLRPLPSDSGVAWGSGIMEQGDFTYVYGIHDGTDKVLYLARVGGHDLSGSWTFWNGTGWSDDEADIVPVLNKGAGNEMSVTPFDDGYLLITQDTSTIFSSDIVAYTACSPAGPFINRGTIYNMPEQTGGSLYGSNVFAYNAHEHLQLRTDNTLTISYNVNSFDSNDLYSDTTIYLPRFVEVGFEITPEDQGENGGGENGGGENGGGENGGGENGGGENGGGEEGAGGQGGSGNEGEGEDGDKVPPKPVKPGAGENLAETGATASGLLWAASALGVLGMAFAGVATAIRKHRKL